MRRGGGGRGLSGSVPLRRAPGIDETAKQELGLRSVTGEEAEDEAPSLPVPQRRVEPLSREAAVALMRSRAAGAVPAAAAGEPGRPPARSAAGVAPSVLSALSRPRPPPQPASKPVERARPTEAVARAGTAASATYNEERLRRAATSGALWRRPAAGAFTAVPDSFPGGSPAYVAAFEALLFEEAREEVRAEWGAACEVGNVHPCRLLSVRREGGAEAGAGGGDAVGGWYSASLALEAAATSAQLPGNGACAVLSTGQPGRDPWRDLQPSAQHPERPPSQTVHLAGLLQRDRGGGGEARLSLRFYLPLAADGAAADEAAAGAAAWNALHSHNGAWFVTAAGRGISAAAAFRALHSLPGLHAPLRQAILDPAAATRRLPDYAQDAPPALPDSLALPAFIGHLSAAFNDAQRKAIYWAAAAAVQAAEGGGGWPFMLVQGPPGTGKTHTVWGMLNVLHLAAYQRYYRDVLAAVAPRSAAAADAAARAAANLASLAAARALYGEDAEEELGARADGGLGSVDEQLALQGLGRTLDSLGRKPRILVAASSNAAVNELQMRVMRPGSRFWGGHGERYSPSVARVASDDAQMPDLAREMTTARRMQHLLSFPPEEREAGRARHRQNAEAMAYNLQRLRTQAEAAAVMGAPAAERQHLLEELVALVERHDRELVDLGRLDLIAAADAALQRGYGGASASLRQALEASFVDEAEIVFTTLASSGRGVFGSLKQGFDLVLIDEAAQASELDALIALRWGARAVILVGDPQQLPATVLSAAARAGLFQRSLFERLAACGAQALLLDTQYRMHPSIRSFPSAYFYQGRLRDDASVAAQPDEPFYAVACLQPYLFFDVAAGRDQRGASRSMRNMGEAALAAGLYAAFRGFLPSGAAKGRCAVLTPYKAQKEALRAAFVAQFGSEAILQEIAIETIDAYQGQERDVVILSLVRAHEQVEAAAPAGEAVDGTTTRNTLGFVTDVRRMNVALTRARRALWVLGHAASLRAAPQWAALIDDARARNSLVPSASAPGLFPHLPPARPLVEESGGRKRARWEVANGPPALTGRALGLPPPVAAAAAAVPRAERPPEAPGVAAARSLGGAGQARAMPRLAYDDV